MTHKNTSLPATFLVASLAVATAVPTLAARGGGAGGGGGGARSVPRPSMGPSVSRPVSQPAAHFSRPQNAVAHPAPTPSRPSFSQVNRPAASPLPAPTPRPSLGIAHPSTPAGTPVTRPVITQRPSTPSLPENRPGIGNGNRPSVSLPGIADRPAPLPVPGGGRPGIGERPGIGVKPPGLADRPIIGDGNRPGGGNRPIIGGGNNIVNRPGGNNNFVNVNRSGWGLGPGGPAGYGRWSDHWYNHYVPPRYRGWYHGCWSGHWGSYWYAPIVAGATAWGLNALLPSWGYRYGFVYSNPYYVQPAVPVYDYSQPIVINSYDMPAADASVESTSDQQAAAAPAPESPQTAEAYQLFDQALAAFKKGDYQSALQLDQQALRKSPDDPVMHEVGALCMFATGDYTGAAAVLNNLLAVAPGMDWTTLSGLYGNIEAYTTQLRALEAHSREKPGDAAACFVLAYHYLVAGYSDAAAGQLKRVVALQPGDQVAKRMLAALTPPTESRTAYPPPEQPAGSPPAQAGPTTDLVGTWRA